VSDEPQRDERYDEAAIRKMADLWALMYAELVEKGVPANEAAKIVRTWIKVTLAKG
jgi:hypothetical protein